MILALTHILVTGLPAALLLDRREPSSRARLLGTSFLLGTGIVSMVMLAMPSRLAVLIATIALWIVALGRARPRPAAAAVRLSIVDVTTATLVLLHGLLATRARVGEGDFWAIWGLKARVFFELGGIDWAYLQNPYNSFAHPDYPPLVPLNYVFVALHGGRWDDRWLGILTTLFGAALVLIVRDRFARELPRHLAALATLPVAAIALSPWIGMAEAPMIAFGSAGLLLLRRGPALTGAVLLGFAACTKNEGLTLLVAAALALLLTSRWRDAIRLWPAAAIAAPWVILRAVHGIRGDLSFLSLDLSHAGPLLRALVKHPPERPLLWVGLAAALVMFVRHLRRERFLLLAVSLQLLAYLGAYMVTRYDVEWHVRYSWPRITDHVAVPLVFVALTLAGAWLSPSRLSKHANDSDGDGDDRRDDDQRDDDGNHDGDDRRDQRHEHAHLHDEQDRQHG